MRLQTGAAVLPESFVRTAVASVLDSAHLARLRAALVASWSQQTSSDPDEWTRDNPALGQCAVTSLVVQDYFGGELVRGLVGGVSHYWTRLPSGKDIDLTKEQFGDAQIDGQTTRSRDYVLSFPETRRRYLELRRRVASRMADC